MGLGINEKEDNMVKNTLIKEVILLLIITILLSSCASSSFDRKIKRESKIIRESEVIVSAGKSSIISNIQLNIRKCNVFDLKISGNYWEYYSGTWMLKNDTLVLKYFNGHKPLFYSTRAYCDKNNKELIFKYEINQNIKFVKFGYTGNFDDN